MSLDRLANCNQILRAKFDVFLLLLQRNIFTRFFFRACACTEVISKLTIIVTIKITFISVSCLFVIELNMDTVRKRTFQLLRRSFKVKKSHNLSSARSVVLKYLYRTDISIADNTRSSTVFCLTGFVRCGILRKISSDLRNKHAGCNYRGYCRLYL